MPTPEEQFTEALKDVNDTLEEVKVTLVEVRDVMSVTPIDAENVPNRVMVTDGSGNSTTSSITTTQLNYLSELSGNVQSQLDNKLDNKLASTNGVLITNSSGNIVTHSTVSVSELSKLDGITDNIMTLLDKRMPRVTDNKNGVLVTGADGAVMVHPSVDYGTLGKLAGTTSNVQEQIDSKLSSSGHSPSKVLVSDANGVARASSVIDTDELSHLNGVKSNIQTQLDDKLVKNGWTGERVLITSENGTVKTTSNVTTTELSQLLNVESNIQDQINGKLTKNGRGEYEVLTTDENGNIIAHPYVDSNELGYLNGLTEYVQPALNAKQAKNIGTVNRALVSNASGEISVSGVTASELNMLKNIKSNVQTQIDDKQSQLTSINSKVAANTLVGEVKWLAFSESVAGWLLCDGRAVSRADYAALFSAIGTTWGAGDGSTTFNLPDLIDKTVWGGASAGGYKEAGLPDHDHSYSSYPRHGAEAHPDLTTARWCDGFEGTETAKVTGTSTKASASNSIYGKSTTVQPPAAVLRPVIKY